MKKKLAGKKESCILIECQHQNTSLISGIWKGFLLIVKRNQVEKRKEGKHWLIGGTKGVANAQ